MRTSNRGQYSCRIINVGGIKKVKGWKQEQNFGGIRDRLKEFQNMVN